MDGFAGEVAALEREHHAAAEDRIEKGEGVAHQQQAGRGAVARVAAVFAGDEVFAGGLRRRERRSLIHRFSSTSRWKIVSRLLHAAAGEIFALGHDADAGHVVVLRDVPEPALVRHVGDGGVAFVDAFAALGILVVGPDGDLVEIRIAHAPAALVGGEGFLARAIERDRRADFVGAAGLAIRGLDADDLLAVHEQAVDRRFLAHFGAFLAGVVEQHLVELRAQHLPGLRDGFAVVAVEEIERLRALPVRLHEGDAVFLHEVRRLHLRDHPDALQRAEGERNERFADVVARKFLALEHEHAMAVFGENGGRRRSRRGRRR